MKRIKVNQKTRIGPTLPVRLEVKSQDMENPIEDLSIFSKYRNRQVVLNYYIEDDFLLKRDGFEFETIKVSNEQISFFKKGKEIFSVPLSDFSSATRNDEFQDFYIFRGANLQKRLELYFPH
jgi:ribosome maturation factor RimP